MEIPKNTLGSKSTLTSAVMSVKVTMEMKDEQYTLKAKDAPPSRINNDRPSIFDAL